MPLIIVLSFCLLCFTAAPLNVPNVTVIQISPEVRTIFIFAKAEMDCQRLYPHLAAVFFVDQTDASDVAASS